MEERAGIYIHVPFCSSKCPYCDFYSLPASEEAMERYTGAMVRAIRHAPELYANTLYFGGGTPTLLGAARLERLLGEAAGRFHLGANAEVAAEANPGTTSRELLSGMKRAGFNRLSFGVQSSDDRVLSLLGRRHTFADAKKAFSEARAVGFENLSADLMLAVPGQTVSSIETEAERMSALPITHLSAYLLKLEPATPFYGRYLDAQDDDRSADCYLAACEALERRGFRQYEISNFALPGRESRHNLKYWKLAPYLGLGPAAHSFLGGRRFYFDRDLEGFCRAGDPMLLLKDDGAGGGFDEAVMLGLRLSEGIDLDRLRALDEARTGRLADRSLSLAKAGLLARDEGRIFLTREGFLLSNSIITRLTAE